MVLRQVEDLPEGFEPEKKKRFRPGVFTYLGLALLLVVLMLGGSYLVWYLSASNALEAQRQEIVERAEPYWFSDLAPQGVPAELDGTPFFYQAVAALQEPAQDFEARMYGNGVAQSDERPPPGDYPEFRAALKQNREALALLRKAIERGHVRLNLEYQTDQPFNVLLDEVQKSRSLARLLRAEVIQALGADDAERAVDAVQQMLGLSELLRDEPILVSQLVRVAIGGMALESLETVLGHANLTPEQSAAMDQHLAEIGARFSFKPAILGERCMIVSTIENLDAQSIGAVTSDSDGLLIYSKITPHVMQEQHLIVELMSRHAATIDQTGPQGAQAAEQFELDVKNLSRRYILAAMLLPAMSACRTAGVRYRQSLNNARLALRVDAHQAEHGDHPASLEEVLDDDLKKVPVGLFSEKPLVYRSSENGFIIYAVGSNARDDGGDQNADVEEANKFEVQYPPAAE